MSYIHFTDEQKFRASEVDLELFLRCQGEKLIRSGPEYRLASDHSVTIRGNEWYDHAAGQGGSPISFLQQFYGLSYPETMTRLLGGEQGIVHEPAQKRKEVPKKVFALPPANREMRRVYAYLLKRRLLDREVVNAFVRAGLLYESCEKFKNREYHNAVFVGKDEHGAARHAHKRSLNSEGRTFRINVEGCDPRYSFHHTGTSDRLYVFEAPIDLLSFLTLYPKGWQEHSYVALCGTSGHAMLWMLEQDPKLRHIALCLDHDEAGIEASGRLADLLHGRDYDSVSMLQPEHKDWNEDLKARHGLPAQEAEEHPQLIAAAPICRRITLFMENARPDRLGKELSSALQGYRMNFQAGRMDAAMDCVEQASALALFAYGREKKQMGEPCSPEALSEELRRRILPHQNRGSIKNRHGEIAAQAQSVLAKCAAPGIRSAGDKEQLAQGWLDLAVSLAKIPVKLLAEYLPPSEEAPQERRHIVSVFKLVQDLLAPSKSNKNKNGFQVLMDLLPDTHKARWRAGAALNSSDQAMASVMSTVLSRLNAFLDSELEQVLCFDSAIDAEIFASRRSAIFLILPEEDPTKNFMAGLMIQTLSRELFYVADKNGGQLPNRVVLFCDELGTMPAFDILPLFSAGRSRKLTLVPIIQSLAQLEKNYSKEGAEIIMDNCQDTIFGGFAPNSQTVEVLSKSLGSRTVLSGSVSRGKEKSQSLQMMERPLMTPDELKSIPKGQFVVMKTGTHPMQTQLRLFLDWGIRFEEPYQVEERAQRSVAYASKQELEQAILQRHPPQRPAQEAPPMATAQQTSHPIGSRRPYPQNRHARERQAERSDMRTKGE